MIRRVWSDLEHFRETEFQPGMNVVIADQADDASETESTNGLGKTTLIRIIQFCFGSDLSRDKVLNHPDLLGVTFGLDFEYRGKVFTVSRSTSKNGDSVSICTEFIEGLAVEIISDQGAIKVVSLDDWKRILTHRFLGRRETTNNLVDLGSPSFRELSYYYMRVGKSAFSDPRQVFQGQKGRQKQLNVAYLLGLNWQSQKSLHDTNEKRSEITKAIKVIETTEDTDADSLGDMEADRVVLEEAIGSKKTDVENFNVRDDYRDLEERLSLVDKQLHDAINENHADTRLLDHYQNSAHEAPEADASRPLDILRDAGAVFREEALRSIDEVTVFHQQVYRNRKAFLDTEISRLKNRIKSRGAEISQFSDSKTEILQILGNSGALESLIQLQRSLTDMTGKLEALKSRIDESKKYDRKKDDLTNEMAKTRTVLKNDLEDRRERVDEAVSLFARYTKHLYGKSAKLGIDVKTSGYVFNITIDRDGSDGVEQMVIFCFDLMIATLRSRRKSPFLTLIHDSALFADVDPRQYGLALQLAEQESRTEGFQYICCLNAGALPKDHLGELDLDAHTRLRITDDSERTRLLGIKLSAREQN